MFNVGGLDDLVCDSWRPEECEVRGMSLCESSCCNLTSLLDHAVGSSGYSYKMASAATVAISRLRNANLTKLVTQLSHRRPRHLTDSPIPLRGIKTGTP